MKRTLKGFGLAAIIAASFALTACAPTEKQKIESHLPEAIPTAYMLFYDKNSVTAADSEPMLLEVAAAMLSSKNIKANINAFRAPDEAADQDTLRAQAIYKFLVDHGVDANRTFANSLGVAEAIGKGNDGAARRRVEIFLAPIAAPKK
jgi:outer membrane protein OmpA-like peptidoglycan-associated protein